MAVAAAAPRQRSFQDVLVVSFGHALAHWYPSTFYLLLPLIGKGLDLSYGEIGRSSPAQYAPAIANIPGGLFVDSVGSKELLMAIALSGSAFPLS